MVIKKAKGKQSNNGSRIKGLGPEEGEKLGVLVKAEALVKAMKRIWI